MSSARMLTLLTRGRTCTPFWPHTCSSACSRAAACASQALLTATNSSARASRAVSRSDTATSLLRLHASAALRAAWLACGDTTHRQLVIEA